MSQFIHVNPFSVSMYWITLKLFYNWQQRRIIVVLIHEKCLYRKTQTKSNQIAIYFFICENIKSLETNQLNTFIEQSHSVIKKNSNADIF